MSEQTSDRNTARSQSSAAATSLPQIIWDSARRDLFFGLPFIPLYSVAELCLGFTVTALVQLIFIDTPRVPVSVLLPERFRAVLNFSQTLDRKDLAFTVPLIIVGAGLVKLVSSFMSSYFIERSGHRVAHSLREKLLHGFLSTPGNILDKKNSDAAANQLMMDTALLQNVVSKGSISALRDGCVIIAVFVSMFLLAFKTVVLALLIIVPGIIALRKAAGVINFYSRESAARQVSIATRALQTKNGLLTVAGLRSQSREMHDFRTLVDQYYEFIRGSFLVRTGFRPATELLVVAILGGLLHWKLTTPEVTNMATYSAIFILAAFAYRPLKNVASLVSQWSEIKAVYERVNHEWVQSSQSGFSITLESLPSSSSDALVATNLTYATPSGSILISQCDVRVPRGSKVALVGESGAGKTTFLRCVAGLLSPQSGRIAIEPQFLLATQFPYVFKGTVRDNIVYSEPVAVHSTAESRARDLVGALRLAHTTAGQQLFFDKNVGFLGEGLSGGERARVALARVLFAGPKIILLDEPTANLDPESAQAFWDALEVWKARDPDHTIVAVSHRLAEVANWDLCYVFEKGLVVESGRPADLIGQQTGTPGGQS